MTRANIQINLTPEDRLQLESMARSKSLPHGLVQRAQIVLMSADGLGGTEVARRTRTTRPTVSLWRSRFRSLYGRAGRWCRRRHYDRRPARLPVLGRT